MATLAEYYKSLGQALPSVGQRQSIASQAGISGYRGTAQQNTQLLGFLQNQNKTSPTTQTSTITPSVMKSATPLNIPAIGNLSGAPINNQQLAQQQGQVPQTNTGLVEPDNYAASQFDLLQTQKTDNQKFQESSIFDILKGLQETQGESAMLQQQQEQAGVFAKEAEYRKISDQIRTRQAQTQQEMATINKSPMSFSARSGYESAVQAANDAEVGALNAQAQAVAGDYEMAIKTAQRAVDAKYKPIKEMLELRKAQLEAIAPLLAADEKRQAESRALALKKEEREYDKQIADEKAVQDLAFLGMQMGAPASLVEKASKAGSKLEAATILGAEYIKDLDIELKKAQIAKIRTDARRVDTTSGNLSDADIKRIDTSPQGKKLISLSNLYQLSNTYKNLVDTYGFKATGANKTLLDNAYADLKIAYKEAANLGALTGPDVGIIEEAVKPASGAKNYLNYRLSGGKTGVSGGIDQALTKARKEALTNYKQLLTRNPKYAGSEYSRSLIAPFAKQYATVNIDTVPKGEIIETEDGILLESLGGGQFSPI